MTLSPTKMKPLTILVLIVIAAAILYSLITNRGGARGPGQGSAMEEGPFEDP